MFDDRADLLAGGGSAAVIGAMRIAVDEDEQPSATIARRDGAQNAPVGEDPRQRPEVAREVAPAGTRRGTRP